MRFFEPSEKFLDWLARYARERFVFDVGCGEAHVTLALQKRKVKAIGIDPGYAWGFYEHTLETTRCVIPRQACEVNILSHKADALALFCRPCHGGWVDDAIQCLHPTTEVVYISRPENVPLDLPGYKTSVLRTPKCREEKVYQVRRAA